MHQDISYAINDLDIPPLLPLEEAALASGSHPAFSKIMEWVQNYLCRPHPDLGRAGPVCPFVPGALQKKLLFAALYEHKGFNKRDIKGILLEEMKRFIALEPTSGNEAQFKSLMVMFPELTVEQAQQIIDPAQSELQKHFVANGLMVGEFHAGPPPKGGLWTPEFRPLHSPVPMLVIRHMVPTDILFLKDDPDLFFGYIKIYGNAVPERFHTQFEQAAVRFGVDMNMGQENTHGAPAIISRLDASNVNYSVHCHDDFSQKIGTPGDFARALGYVEQRITKTLFLRGHKSRQYLLLSVPIDKRIDFHSLSGQLEVGRLELASLEELQRLVGYPPTSVTPITVDKVPMFMDESLLTHSTILTGSGVPRVEIEITPGDLVKVCNGKTVTLS